MTLTAKQINATSIKLGETNGKLADAIHSHALVIAEHIAQHGDVTLATNLVNALKRHRKVNDLRQWFCDFGGCGWNSQKESFTRSKKVNPDVAQGAANPFYDYVKEAPFAPIDGAAMIRAAIAKIKKAQTLLSDNTLTAAQKAKIKNVDAVFLAKLEALI